MNTRTMAPARIALIVLFALSLVLLHLDVARANTKLDCTAAGPPFVELHDWLPNETVTLIANGQVVGEFTTDANGFGSFTFGQPGVTYEVSVRNAGDGNPIPIGSITCEGPPPAPPRQLQVKPASSEIEVDESQFISANWKDHLGVEAELAAEEWAAWAASGGQIEQDSNASATFTAGEPGSYTITARVGDFLASAEVVVKAPPETPPRQLQVKPASSEIEADESQFISANWKDHLGVEAELAAEEWAAWAASGGQLEQNDNASATFSAGEPGEYTITARVGDASASAQVVVQAPPAPPRQLQLDPASAEIEPDISIAIRANWKDDLGVEKELDAEAWAAWTVSGGQLEQNDNSSATFSADEPGEYTITALVDGFSASAQVVVKAPPEPPSVARVEIQPAQVTIEGGQTQAFEATAYDDQGAPLDVEWSWTASEGRIGRGGTYTATLPGEHTITAEAQGTRGSATVTVEPDPPLLPWIVGGGLGAAALAALAWGVVSRKPK